MNKDIFRIQRGEQKKNVKERILDTALRLFYSQGIKHTGINRIISQAGVAKASFYQYFPSKVDLIIACLHIYNVMILSVVRRMVKKSTTLLSFFKRWSRLILRSAVGNNSFNGCPIANIAFQVAPENHRLKEEFSKITASWQSCLLPLFDNARKSGEIPPETDADSFFREIILINEGAFIMWRLTGDIHYIRGMETAFLRLLASRSSTE